MPFDAIVFFIPQLKLVSGGVMSIFSLCNETRTLFEKQKTDVFISVLPGYETYGKNDLFVNDERIYDMDGLMKELRDRHNILFHVPEYAINDVTLHIRPYIKKLSKARISVNILNQNVTLMPDRLAVADIFEISPTVTQTIAHKRYCTQELADKYAVSTHLFSVYIDPSQYAQLPYSQKKNIIAYSPDGHPKKERVLQKLSEGMPGFDLVEINNLTYDEYKTLIREVKFVITFGEGLDGYLIEPTFSGTVAFSVFNSDFFPDDSFLEFGTIFPSYDEMLDAIVKRMRAIDNSEEYERMVSLLYKKLAQLYSYKSYQQNVRDYYEGKLSFNPKPSSVYELFSDKLAKTMPELHDITAVLKETQSKLATTSAALTEKEAILADIYLSKKWHYITKIQRGLSKIMSRKPSA